MNRSLYRAKVQRIKRAVLRGVLICSLAATLLATFGTALNAQPVSAAAASATTYRQDRRPDRERPVATSQGSSDSSSSHSRPRLVRR